MVQAIEVKLFLIRSLNVASAFLFFFHSASLSLCSDSCVYDNTGKELNMAHFLFPLRSLEGKLDNNNISALRFPGSGSP